MIEIILKYKIFYLVNHPFRLAGLIGYLAFIYVNIYLLSLLVLEEPFKELDIISYVKLFPVALVLLSDFIPNYRLNVILLPRIYPVSNFKNALLSLLNDLFHVKYLAALIILAELYFYFDCKESIIVEILLLLLSITTLKFCIHYVVYIISSKSLASLVVSSFLFTAQVVNYFLYQYLVISVILVFIQLVLFFSLFSALRYHYFFGRRVNIRKVNKSNIIWLIYNVYIQYKNLFLVFILVKIGFVILFALYFNLTGEILISTLALVIVLSPIFLFTYFHNNFIVLNYRVFKNLSLVYNSSKIVIIQLAIVLISSIMDFLFSVPIFIVFGFRYLLIYLILLFSFTLTSVFISLYFPHEKKDTGLWIKGTTSKVGTFILLFYIFCVLEPINTNILIVLPIIISIIFLLIARVHHVKKQTDLFNKYKY